MILQTLIIIGYVTWLGLSMALNPKFKNPTVWGIELCGRTRKSLFVLHRDSFESILIQILSHSSIRVKRGGMGHRDKTGQ